MKLNLSFHDSRALGSAGVPPAGPRVSRGPSSVVRRSFRKGAGHFAKRTSLDVRCSPRDAENGRRDARATRTIAALLAFFVLFASQSLAATINWAAGIDSGLSLSGGANLAAGSLVRVGYFRDPSSGVQLTDAQIQALASSPVTLNNSFVEVGSTPVGTGVGSVAGHFAATSSADTGSSGLNVAGKQIYVWVFNAPTLVGATQQGIFYWLNTNTATNPDSTPETPGARWSFPAQDPPGVTTVDLTDLTTGTSALAAGAHVVVGSFSAGTSSTTGAANFGLAAIASGTPAITTTSPLTSGVVGTAYSQTFTGTGGTSPYTWSVSGGTLPTGLTLSSAGVLGGTPTTTGTFSFTVRITDSLSATSTTAFTATIYLTTSANGINIPSPTSTTTYNVADGANTVAVPENMVYVPAGSFTYGTGATATSVALDGFCINRFHVTNAEYKAFLNATGSTSYPSYWSGGTYPAGKANHPVNFVSLTKANAYAAWVSAQTGMNVVVPTAYQWEKAARGTSAYTYPWGNTQDATYTGGVLTAKANFNANVTSFYLTSHGSDAATYNNASSTHYNQTVTVGTIAAYDASDVATALAVTSSAAVNGYVNHTTYTGFIYTDVFDAINAAGGYTTPEGSYPTGVSPYGAYDMGGNLWHWTTTTFVATNGAEAGQTVNMVRGGSWYSTGGSCKTYDIGEGRLATGNYNSVGFRVAMLPPGYGAAVTINSTSPLAGGVVGTSYSQTLVATGGTTPYAWSVSSGTVPTGLTFSSAGVLGGTPAAAGSFTFTAQVTDSAASPASTTKSFTVVIAASALAITTTSPLNGGTVGTAYSQTLAASGGTTAYSWSVTSGTLPAGLALSTAGVLSGTPTAAGVSSFTVQVADSGGLTATQTFSLTTIIPPLSITTASPLTSGTLGTAYSVTLAATGGTSPYTWNVSAGTLPAGLALSAAGVLSGTPTAAGTFNFTAQVTDSASTAATKSFALTISASGPLHHFTWDYVPASANANNPFAARLTARDSAGALVSSFNGTVGISAASGSGSSALSPIIVTEATPGSETQIEIQNVGSATVNTAGWFIRIGDSATNSVAGMNTVNATTYNLPASMTVGQIVRLTESSSNTANGRVYFGSAIAWSNIPGSRRGWVGVFDGTSALRDFVAWGWTATDIAGFSITVNAATITLGTQWTGAGITATTGAPGAVTVDSFQRTGTSDSNSATGWSWYHNTDNSDATTLGSTNAALTIPWANTGSTALTVSPASATFTNGEYLGYLTIAQAANNATMTANDGSSHTGTTASFPVGAALLSTAGDGIPDSWKIANGFSAAANIASLDSDGDGMTNYQEYLAGTDPRSVNSSLKISSFSVPASGQFSITWPGLAGKLYRVRTSPDLSTWTTLTTLLPTTSGTQTVTMDTGGATTLFVRVEIVP